MECLAVNQQRFASVIDNINKELNQKGKCDSVVTRKVDQMWFCLLARQVHAILCVSQNSRCDSVRQTGTSDPVSARKVKMILFVSWKGNCDSVSQW